MLLQPPTHTSTCLQEQLGRQNRVTPEGPPFTFLFLHTLILPGCIPTNTLGVACWTWKRMLLACKTQLVSLKMQLDGNKWEVVEVNVNKECSGSSTTFVHLAVAEQSRGRWPQNAALSRPWPTGQTCPLEEWDLLFCWRTSTLLQQYHP